MHWIEKSFAELSAADLHQVLALRVAIFVVEQACAYQEVDGLDPHAIHIMVRSEGDDLLAYLRCLPPGRPYQQSGLGRIVVATAARGTGLGRSLITAGIACNRKHWPDADILIHAQAALEDYYAEFGFVSCGPVFDEDGIPHRQMLLAGS